MEEEEGGHGADEDHGQVALSALHGHPLLPLLLHQVACRNIARK